MALKVLGIVSQKGGPGKTMLATNLSVEAEQNGHTVALIDTDPQASSAKWGDHRESETLAVTTSPVSRLDKELEFVEENGATLVIIDTAPNTGHETPEIIKKSTIVLIPTKTSAADIEAIKNTLTVAEMAKKPAYVVLNMVKANSPLGKHAREAVEDLNAECLPCQIGDRAAFIHAYNSGASVPEIEPYSKSADEIRQLYNYLANIMEV